MNDVHENPIDVNSEHLLNFIMSNTPEVRKRNYQANVARREQRGGNTLSKCLDPNTAIHFTSNKVFKSTFDRRDMHDKDRRPVDLTSLGDPLEFLANQTSVPFAMRVCPFCDKELNYLMTRDAHVEVCDKTTISKSNRRDRATKMHLLLLLSFSLLLTCCLQKHAIGT